MTNEQKHQDDYIRAWRHDYDAARDARNGTVVAWSFCAVTLGILAGDGLLNTVEFIFAFTLGGFALALLSHYQGVIHTYYQALKGTRDEPPRDELAARRRR